MLTFKYTIVQRKFCCEPRQLRMCTEQVSGLTREMMIASFPRRGAATDYVSCQLGVTCHQLFSLRVIEPVRVYGHIPLVDPRSECIGQPAFILHCFHCNTAVT